MFEIIIMGKELTIHYYGACLFFGFIVAYIFSYLKMKKLNIPYSIFTDLFFWCLFGMIIGSKLFLLKNYKQGIIQTIFSSKSGYSLYGGTICALLIFFFRSRFHKLNFLKLADSLIAGVSLSLSIIRIGCFLHGCCLGKSFLMFKEMYHLTFFNFSFFDDSFVFPSQIISSVFHFFLFFVFLILEKKKSFDGEIFLKYVIIYGMFRFLIDFFRFYENYFFNILSLSQFFSIILISAGFCFYSKLKGRS